MVTKKENPLIIKLKKKYKERNMPWTWKDTFCWGFTINVFPSMIFMGLMLFLFKKLFLDYMLVNKGFETTIVSMAILLLLRPTLNMVIGKAFDNFKQQ